MAKEDNDANNEQVVTAQDANNEQVVDAQGENTEVTNQEQSQNDPVPYERFKEVNDAKKAAEEKAAFAQRELEVNQQAQQLASQQQTAQPVGTNYEQAMINLNLKADDMYDGQNVVNVNIEKERLDRIVNQHQTALTANLQFMTSHSDFNQVVGSVNPTTGHVAWSQEALALQAKKPYLAGAFQSAQGAYNAIMDERKLVELEKASAVNQEHLNRQNADNETLPLGGSAGGGGGSEQNHTTTLLTRDQVKAEEAKIAAGDYD